MRLNELSELKVREAVKGTGIPDKATMPRLWAAIAAGRTEMFSTWLKGAVYFQAIEEFKLSKLEAVAAATQPEICSATAEIELV